jgi:hypothetical protein
MAQFNGFPREYFSFFNKLKKIPRGYDAQHPNAEYLLFNGLTARVEEKVPETFYSGALIDYAYTHYKNMLPLHRWLKKALDE